MNPNLKFVLNLDLASKLSHDLVPFVQFRKGEKHPLRSVAKVTLLYECFLRFQNFTNGTKSRNASHIYQ